MLDRLKEGIYLRGYGMKDPVSEFKREGFQLFEQFLNEFKYATVQALLNIQLEQPSPPQGTAVEQPQSGADRTTPLPSEDLSGKGASQSGKSKTPFPPAGMVEVKTSPREEKKPRVPQPRKLKDRLKERKKDSK